MENNPLKKQNRKVTIFAFILSFLAIGILVFGFILVSSDKVVMLQSISNLYNRVTDLDEDTSILLDKLSSSKNISISSNIELKTDDNSYNIKLDYTENKSLKKSNLDLNISNLENTLLDGNVLFEDNNAYLFLNEITSTYYSTKFNYKSILNSISSSDYEKIMDLFKEALDDSIDNDDISKDKATIKYKGKDKKVNRLTFDINSEKLKEIIKKFIKSVKNDKTLMKNLSAFIDVDADKLETRIYKQLNIDPNDEKVIFSYKTYYYGFNRIVQYELDIPSINQVLTYKVEDDISTLTLNMNEIELFNLITNKNKAGYTFEGSVNSIFINSIKELKYLNFNLSNTYKFSGKYENHSLEMTVESDNNYKALIKGNSDTSGNTLNYNITITLYNVIDDIEKEILYIKAENEFSFDKKIDVNINESKDFGDITEEELIALEENLSNMPFYDTFKQFIGFEKMEKVN